MIFTSGARLGPYEILSAIGAGGQGEVYKARDTRLNRTVAIKVLPSHFSHNPEMKTRFEREAQTIAGLNHPHICVLYDVGNQDGTDSNAHSTNTRLTAPLPGFDGDDLSVAHQLNSIRTAGSVHFHGLRN